MAERDKLTVLLADFAHTLGEDFPIQDILDRFVQRVVDVLPVTGAGVMLMGAATDLYFFSASNETILQIQTLQDELGEGPCLEAYASGEAVTIPDLSVDQRFPRFSARARDAGLAAVFSLPMTMHGSRMGALDLYRDQPGELDSADRWSAQILADVAAAYVHNARGRAAAVDAAELLRHRSLHDPLTGLANRTLLRERLDHAVSRASRSHQVVAVLFVDLDHFKAVNDRFGHHVGDKLLVAVARRLNQIVRAGDTLARLSGDEFVLLCEDLESAESAETVAERIVAALEPAFALDGVRVKVTASVGVAFAGPGEEMPENLLRDADFAMYQAKQAGGAQHQLLDHAARTAAEGRALLARELRIALDEQEFRLAYQPLVDVNSRYLVGVEALLRWQHPRRGWVMPNDILPIAEQNGIIQQIGDWVLGQACRDLQRWQQAYGPAMIPQVTVNVSPHQLMTSGFGATVQRVLEATGTDPAHIFLEVTENAFLEDGPRALSVLEQIRSLGVGLILDDFGTGYSSLSYLRRFPFDVLKIDQTFITNLGDDGTRQIVAAIIDLAHALNLTVVAEGIETEQQLADVTDLGSDRAQGYHFCPPLLVEQIDRRILEPAAAPPILLPLPRRPS